MTAAHKGRATIRRSGMGEGAADQFVGLWSWTTTPGTTMARLETAYVTGLDAVDRMEARTKQNASSGKLTPAGAREDALNYAIRELVPQLHRARASIKNARIELAERRAKLEVPLPEPGDLAGALRRSEIRSWLREMPAEKQALFFAEQGARLPADVALAVLEMPPEFSGVPATRHRAVADAVLASKFGDEIEALRQMERAIGTAEKAVELGRREVRVEAGGVSEAEFDKLAAPVEAKCAAPWLRRKRNAAGVEGGIL